MAVTYRISLPSLFLCTLVCASATCDESRYSSKEFNFSLTPPATVPTGGAVTVAAFFMPAFNAFAPNVIVMVQPWKGTMEGYCDMSSKEIEKMKATILRQEMTDDSAHYEYSGIIQGKHTHVYTRVDKVGDMIYLTSATDLEEHWAKTSVALIASVKSFTLGAIKKGAQTIAVP